jgi:hypothetical protein
MRFNAWMTKEDWAKEICGMHQVESKLIVAQILHQSFEEKGKDLDTLELQEVTLRQSLRVSIACQMLSIAFELTEDVAATCFSYAKAIKNNNKNVAEYLRDFGVPNKTDSGNPKNFFDSASKEIVYAAEMLGVDPITNVAEAIFGLNFFRNIRGFRNQYDDWYQGYKHGQRTIAIHAVPVDVEPTKENTNFFLYHIPQTIQEIKGQIFVEQDIISILPEEPNFFTIIQTLVRMWAQIKNHQYARVFPPDVPALPSANP